ncbi:MAG: 2Fe-2S iron-sulfur cluster-binding protein [Anaerolineales bacterium]
MDDRITLTINNQSVRVAAGTTILQAAQSIGISIPTICYHEHCTANALCRICVVEVTGSRTLVPSCKATVSEGMQVNTTSERVLRARKVILEMLQASVDLSEAPEIQAMMAASQADPQRFPNAVKRKSALLDDNPMFLRDYNKCVLCWRCVQVCAEDAQYTFAINFAGRGFDTQISTFYHVSLPESTCVFCGQCIGVCPTGALKPKREALLEDGFSLNEIVELTKMQWRKKKSI